MSKRAKEFRAKVDYLREVGDGQGLLDVYFATDQKIEAPKNTTYTDAFKTKNKRLTARKARKRNRRKRG
jgi:hypothetical protein